MSLLLHFGGKDRADLVPCKVATMIFLFTNKLTVTLKINNQHTLKNKQFEQSTHTSRGETETTGVPLPLLDIMKSSVFIRRHGDFGK